jgi:hypothetical protein
MMLRIFESSAYAVTFIAVGLTFFECFMSANYLLTLAITQ